MCDRITLVSKKNILFLKRRLLSEFVANKFKYRIVYRSFFYMSVSNRRKQENTNEAYRVHKMPTFCHSYPKDEEGNVFKLSTTGGTEVPGSFQGLWSQVLSRGYPSPGQGYPRIGGYPRTGVTSLARTGVISSQDRGTPWDRLCCGRYVSCGFPQEDFLVQIMCLSQNFKSNNHRDHKLYNSNSKLI